MTNAAPNADAGNTIQFGPFEATPRTRELTKHGRRLRLPGLPFEVLLALLERPGDLVTRDELHRRLWSDGTSVDFDNNLNAAVARLRQTLGDSADAPRFIETLPRLGYRFIGEVARTAARPAASAQPAASDQPVPTPAASGRQSAAPPDAPRHGRARQIAAALAGVAAVVGLATVAGWNLKGASSDPSADRLMFAVLPFDNLSGDPDQQYLSDGLTEEMITELARIDPERLGIIARTTTFRYRGGAKDIQQIARELGVDYVIEGSVRRHGSRVRVTAQLIEPERQTHVWAQSYDHELRDLLAVERDVATAVARAVRLAVDPAAAPRVSGNVSEAARDAYLQARYYSAEGTVFSIEKAIELYAAAVRAAPDYALAHAALARTLIFATRTEPGAALSQAREAAARALALDPTLPEAQLAWAMVTLYRDRHLDAAGHAFARAVASDPGSAEAHFYHSHYLTAAGRFDEALAAANRALALDPFSTLIHHYVGRILGFAGRSGEAVAHLQKTLDLEPNYPWALLFKVVAHEQNGEFDQAVAARQQYWAVMGVPPDRVTRLGEAYKASGYAAVRQEWINWLEGFARERGFVTSTELAMLYAAQGRPDQAFQWLERAVAAQTRDLIYLQVYRELSPLRSDARYAPIVARVFPQ